MSRRNPLGRIFVYIGTLSAFAGSLACARRHPSPPVTKTLDASVVGSASSASASLAPPNDGCPRWPFNETPWSGGGLIRSLEPAGILEPALREEKVALSELSWELVEPPVVAETGTAHLAVASLKAFAKGAAIVGLRRAEAGYCIVGAWYYSFGGAGVWAKHLGHENSVDGEDLVSVYGLTEGWNNGGSNTWICSLRAFKISTVDLNLVYEKKEMACDDLPERVRFTRTPRKLTLKYARSSQLVDELTAD